MKALILAAGRGSRLSPLTDHQPKSLVEVAGKPIIMKQIENLYKNDIYDITIISGYKADILENVVRSVYPKVKMIENVDYTTTNNMYSAYLAKKAMDEEGFLMMNADVFFDASIIRALMSFPAENAIVTDIGNYLEESMKVVQKEDRLVAISKEVCKKDALGTSIDIYKFSAEGAEAFWNKCVEYIVGRHELGKWSEVAINDILSEVIFKACPLDGRWVEIDNHEDLEMARNLFGD